MEDNSIKCISHEKTEVKPDLKELEKANKELKDRNSERQENPIKLRKQGTNKNVKLHMYQIKNSKSKNQIKLPREKNRMHAQLSHATQNYDLNIGQNQPAVSEKICFLHNW